MTNIIITVITEISIHYKTTLTTGIHFPPPGGDDESLFSCQLLRGECHMCPLAPSRCYETIYPIGIDEYTNNLGDPMESYILLTVQAGPFADPSYFLTK